MVDEPGTGGLGVSVVVPTIGRPLLLTRCLQSILACDPPAGEVIVVDQSAGDEVGRCVEALGATTARVVACPARGIARATNLGFASARHGMVLVTHDDCTVAPDWVAVAHRLLLRHPYAMLTGRVLPPDGSGYVPSTIVSEEPHDYTGSVTSGVLYPANMAVDRNALLAFGGFDERRGLELAAEDNDLCFRWLCAGRALRFEPELVVWHHDWRSPAELLRTHITYAHGQGAFYAKHLRAGERRILPLLRWDLSHGIDAVAVGVLKRRPRWQDPYREMVVALLWGIAANLPEANRLARQGPRQPDD
ncbi:MAG TPA: glycosyltransferase [Acidimicrobiales bacterium]